jgi:hypothetical protein
MMPRSPTKPGVPVLPTYEQHQHVDPFAVAERSKLSPEATPYTPTKQLTGSNTPKFPSSPSKADMAAAPTTNAKDAPATPTSQEPTSTSTTTSNGEKTSPNTAPTPAATTTATAPQRTTPPPKPFAVTRLPFPAEPAPVPAAPINFNTSWTLHADDHAIVLGAGEKSQYRDPVVIGDVKDVESFWKLWNNVPPVMSRTPNFTYYWFRKDIKPNWEDAKNKNGGTLNVVLYDRDRCELNDRAVVDDSFMLSVVACTGEAITGSSEVNGVVLKLRQKSVVLQLWTSTTVRAQLQSIADSLKEVLAPYAAKASLEKGKIDFYTHQQVISVVQAKSAKKPGKPNAKPTVREPDFQF